MGERVRRALTTNPRTAGQQSSRPLRLATAAVMAYGVLLPLTRVYSAVTTSQTAVRTVAVVAAFCCFVPVQVWLVSVAARSTWTHKHSAALAALVAILAAMLPVAGVDWVGIFNVPAAVTLVALRRPWSLLLFAIFVAAPAPLTAALGHPEWSIYFALSMPFTALPLATGLWLVRVAGQLQMARAELANQAVIRERLRVGDEVRITVGARLDEIAMQAARVKALLDADPQSVPGVLGALADNARQTLADARRAVGRYRAASLRAEVETVATLLSAAGFETRLQLPPGGLPGSLEEAERRKLHRAVGNLMSSRPGRVTITVTVVDDLAHVALRSGSDVWTAEVAFA